MTLISIDERYGYFKDSTGTECRALHSSEGQFFNLALMSDLDEALKMFKNRKLWTNVTELFGGAGLADSSHKEKILTGRFQPVTVIDVIFSYSHILPHTFIVKTADGRIGYEDVNVSSTNAILQPN